VGPTVSLDAVAKRRNASFAPAGIRTPVVQPVAESLYRQSYSGSLFIISTREKRHVHIIFVDRGVDVRLLLKWILGK
jgi:hypothetical protein